MVSREFGVVNPLGVESGKPVKLITEVESLLEQHLLAHIVLECLLVCFRDGGGEADLTLVGLKSRF